MLLVPGGSCNSTECESEPSGLTYAADAGAIKEAIDTTAVNVNTRILLYNMAGLPKIDFYAYKLFN